MPRSNTLPLTTAAAAAIGIEMLLQHLMKQNTLITTIATEYMYRQLIMNNLKMSDLQAISN